MSLGGPLQSLDLQLLRETPRECEAEKRIFQGVGGKETEGKLSVLLAIFIPTRIIIIIVIACC